MPELEANLMSLFIVTPNVHNVSGQFDMYWNHWNLRCFMFCF